MELTTCVTDLQRKESRKKKVTEGHETKESENCSPRASNVTDYLWLSNTLCV